MTMLAAGREHMKRPPPPPESLCLPAGYSQQVSNLTLDDHREDGDAYWSEWRIGESHRWQHHVYAWAARLIVAGGIGPRAAGAQGPWSVLDVGCGVGTKLARHILPVCADVTAVDQPSALAVAARRGIACGMRAIDLEAPDLDLGRTFDLVICADVIEHLVDPDPMLGFVWRHMGPRSLLLISTPERDRERGRDCRASLKPEHVREWARAEFRAFMQSRGFRVLRSRLLPKDERPIATCREGEREFRLGRAACSPFCCQALLCAPGGPTREVRS